jgi:hypothetical protein
MGVGYVEIVDAVGIKIGVIPDLGIGSDPESELTTLLKRIVYGLESGFIEAVLNGTLIGVPCEMGNVEQKGLAPWCLGGDRGGGLVVRNHCCCCICCW